jgi:rubrerythrin
MPWCPSCESEYRDTVTLCPACAVALVDVLPEAPEEIDDSELFDSGEELAVIARGEFSRCLEMRAALKAAQIPCALLREAQEPGSDHARERVHHITVELLVEVTRVDDAARVLESKWHELVAKEGLAPASPDQPESEEVMHCPACGYALRDEVTECPDCGLTFGDA